MSEVRAEPGPDGVRLSGKLDASTVPALLGDIDGWFADAGRAVRIDLSGVERADSAGVAFLLETQRHARAAGGSVAFINAPAQMQAIIGFCALDQVLDLQQ